MAEQIRGSGGDESPLNRGRKNESALSLHHSELVQGFSTWFNKKQVVTFRRRSSWGDIPKAKFSRSS